MKINLNVIKSKIVIIVLTMLIFIFFVNCTSNEIENNLAIDKNNNKTTYSIYNSNDNANNTSNNLKTENINDSSNNYTENGRNISNTMSPGNVLQPNNTFTANYYTTRPGNIYRPAFTFVYNNSSNINSDKNSNTTAIDVPKADISTSSKTNTPKTTASNTPNTTANTTAPAADTRVLKSINRYIAEPDILYSINQNVYNTYKKLVDGILKRSAVIELSNNITDNNYCIKMLKESPYDFIIKSHSFAPDNKNCNITYRYTKSQQDEIISFIENEMLNIINETVKSTYNDLEKILVIYNYFSNKITYDHEKIAHIKSNPGDPVYVGIEIYEGLKYSKGVCHCYAYLCRYALFQLGIDVFCIRGDVDWDPDSYHVWNMVKINGNFYHIDPTWEPQGSKSLRYFGMTDAQRKATGIPFPEFNTNHRAEYGNIKCIDTSFSMFHTKAKSWEFYGNHIIQVTLINGSKILFDTENLKVV